MKVNYRIKKENKGEPYWRLSITTINKNIDIRVENYKWGFLDGEKWDEIFVYNNMAIETRYRVSLMTKSSYEELMSRYDEVINTFYNNLFNIEKSINEKFEKQKLNYHSDITELNSIKSSDLFKNIYRDEKIKEVLDAN